jgi:response regulator RpfG family c-di-GMP phosphodiesterase
MSEEAINILLVEDDPEYARRVQEAVTEAGAAKFNLTWWDNLASGLNHLQEYPPEVILLDITSPDHSGHETYRKVHNLVPHIPIILLTGMDDDELADKMMREGAEDFLNKENLNGSMLRRSIRYAMELNQKKEELARLYTQKMRHLQNLAALRVVDAAIANSFDIKYTLGTLQDQLIEQLRIDATRIIIFDPAGKTLQSLVAQGFKSISLEPSNLRFNENIARQVFHGKQAIAIDDLAAITEESFGAADLVRVGFTAYLGVPLIAKGLIRGVLELYQSRPIALDQDQRTFLDMLAGQAAIAIDSAQLFDNLQGSNFELMMAYDETIEGWSQALDLRDKETEGHSRRVTEMTVKLAAHFGSSPEELIDKRRGALLHDIGKLGVPDEILRKPQALNENEWMIMREHPQFAYDMLAPITYLTPALDIPFCHHEKWDGSGYPRGLKGNQIPLGARIFAVVDVWDALTSDRPYRGAWSKEAALAHIQEQAGKQFDPGVVSVFLREIVDKDKIF